MDKIWNPESWPRPLLNGINLIQHTKGFKAMVDTFNFANKFTQYLICVWQTHKLSVATLQLGFSIASRFSRKNQKYHESTQLILVVSVFIASKTLDTDNIGVSLIHKISNHSFTNKDIYRMEQRILNELDFNLLEEGICDFYVVSLLKAVDFLVEESIFEVLHKVCEDIQVLIWFTLLSYPDKIPYKCCYMLPAAIVQISLILTTHCAGRFPATVWMIHIFKLNEDELNNFVEILMKVVLGKDKMEQIHL